ncbi:MAG: HEAT repeat domain-containing protein [Isosphaeraceae bacterium]
MAPAVVPGPAGRPPGFPAPPAPPLGRRFGPPGRIGPPGVPVPNGPPEIPGATAPPADPSQTVTLRVSGLDDETRDVFNEKLSAAKLGSFRGFGTGAGRTTYTVWPVSDVDEFARKITWARVTRVVGRTVFVEMAPVTGGRGRPTNADPLSSAMFDLSSPAQNKRRQGLSVIVNRPPDAARRAEVAKALESLLEDNDGFIRADAAKALGRWGGPENTPALVEALNDTAFNVVWAALDALAERKDPASAEAIAARLATPRDRGKAVEALKAIGPPAEKAVLTALSSSDWVTRMEVCKILQVIGTQDCVPALQELIRRNNGQGIDTMEARKTLSGLNAPEVPASSRTRRGSTRSRGR